MPVIYLDNNATTRLDDRVLTAMLPFFTEQYANAVSSHLFGLTIKEAVENAQQQIADLIGARPTEIIFTSGATESINFAIKGLGNNSRKHIVAVTTEHKAVLDTCPYMEKDGFTVTYLTVNKNGLIDLDELKANITDDTLLVCIMLANNETGVIQPITEVVNIAHTKGALLLCDATQAVGKIPVNVKNLGIDLMPFSAHKFYGPKGVGGLFVSSKISKLLSPQIHGGGQQRNLRSGTLNVTGIIGLGKASEIALTDMQDDVLRIRDLRNSLEKELLKIKGSSINGDTDSRLPNTTNICFPGVNSEKLIIGLQNIAVSSGSACSAVTTEPSHVLKAMGLSDADALASIRFSLGRFTTAEEIETAISKVTELVVKMRQQVI
ncbi:cysteine desulfurase family protein [Flavobacterium sp. DG1-102-2]|uniref:cysteine desulfurase family protein n=1 Tax=Flavobacterium sp. DG1-102-2 TaxID=3081663 RepID=UPI002948FD0E|nr:cysteine desulfurase family protein [Flavobacterium sp. DG1-102-2]MDV6167183.1 cysteine desulfurase family protein [Flavobacterium sp. DG1-102-2]